MAINLYIESNYYDDFISFEENGNPDISILKFSDAAISGFENISNIIAINKFIDFIKAVSINGVDYYCDYKFCRDRIKDLFVSWGECTLEEKFILCKHNIGDKSDRIALIGFNNYQLSMVNYGNKATTISRGNRIPFVKSEVWSRLDIDKAREIAEESEKVLYLYQENGIEGTLYDSGQEGIDDYIYGRAGTSFEGDGILQKSLGTIEGFSTNQDFCDYLKGITIDGEKMNLSLASEMNLLNV